MEDPSIQDIIIVLYEFEMCMCTCYKGYNADIHIVSLLSIIIRIVRVAGKIHIASSRLRLHHIPICEITSRCYSRLSCAFVTDERFELRQLLARLSRSPKPFIIHGVGHSLPSVRSPRNCQHCTTTCVTGRLRKIDDLELSPAVEENMTINDRPRLRSVVVAGCKLIVRDVVVVQLASSEHVLAAVAKESFRHRLSKNRLNLNSLIFFLVPRTGNTAHAVLHDKNGERIVAPRALVDVEAQDSGYETALEVPKLVRVN